MMNNKGFTLTEVLLAAMIVGIIGVALAALTTAALRESSVGRTRITLRNQISLFLRQLRQDVQEADAATVRPDHGAVRLTTRDGAMSVTYTCTCGTDEGGACMRTGAKNGQNIQETVLNYVRCGGGNLFRIASVATGEEGGVNSVLHVHLVVGTDGNPPVREAIDETLVLAQGVVSK